MLGRMEREEKEEERRKKNDNDTPLSQKIGGDYFLERPVWLPFLQ